VTPVDARVQVFEQADLAAVSAVAGVTGERDEVEAVDDGGRAGQVRDEDDGGLQRCDEDGLEADVVAGDLAAELADPRVDLLRGEVDVSDSRIGIR